MASTDNTTDCLGYSFFICPSVRKLLIYDLPVWSFSLDVLEILLKFKHGHSRIVPCLLTSMNLGYLY